MTDPDQLYFANRARQERERARAADDNSAALIHHRLADAYEERMRAFVLDPSR